MAALLSWYVQNFPCNRPNMLWTRAFQNSTEFRIWAKYHLWDGCWALVAIIPPLHRGCDLSASIVRPQNWPGRRWRQKGGRTVALVVQGWYTGRSNIAMDAMVAVKFWACSKQSHKGRRGGRSLTCRLKEAGGRHTHRRGDRMDAQWSAMIGRPVKKYVLLWTLCINLSNASVFLVPPLCLLWPTNSIHWTITVATTVPPFGDHGNPSATLAMVLPPLCLLCATCCPTTAALVVQGRHKGRATAVTQKQNFLGLGDHWASWPFFWSLKGGTKVTALCKGGFIGTARLVPYHLVEWQHLICR